MVSAYNPETSSFKVQTYCEFVQCGACAAAATPIADIVHDEGRSDFSMPNLRSFKP